LLFGESWNEGFLLIFDNTFFLSLIGLFIFIFESKELLVELKLNPLGRLFKLVSVIENEEFELNILLSFWNEYLLLFFG